MHYQKQIKIAHLVSTSRLEQNTSLGKLQTLPADLIVFYHIPHLLFLKQISPAETNGLRELGWEYYSLGEWKWTANRCCSNKRSISSDHVFLAEKQISLQERDTHQQAHIKTNLQYTHAYTSIKAEIPALLPHTYNYIKMMSWHGALLSIFLMVSFLSLFCDL